MISRSLEIVNHVVSWLLLRFGSGCLWCFGSRWSQAFTSRLGVSTKRRRCDHDRTQLFSP